MFNESAEILPIDILNKKTQNPMITVAYSPLKENSKLIKDFYKEFSEISFRRF